MTQYSTPVNRSNSVNRSNPVNRSLSAAGSNSLPSTLPNSLPETPTAGAPWQDSARVSATTRSQARWLTQKPVPRRREKSVADLAAAAVRRANARDCLTILLEATKPLTVAELAARSGLSRPTVDAVLHELIEAGPVSASEPPECHSPGRPARRFAVDPTSTLVAGIEVTADSIDCTVTDAAGRTVARTRTTPAPYADRLDAVAEVINATVKQAGHAEDDHDGPDGGARLAVVGLAVPGIVDHDHRLTGSRALPDWEGIDVGALLSQRLGCSVVVENDLKLATLAEHHLSRTAENLIYLQLGRRISVAIMVGGRILQGSHRLAGELDAQRGTRWTTSYDRAGLNWSTGREAEPLFERAAAGDRAATAEIEDFCRQIAPRLVTLMLTVDPETVIIGGGLSRAGDVLLEPLRHAIDQLLTTSVRPELVAARLTETAARTGAIGYAFEQGSEEIFGIEAMPAPWCRLREQPVTDPRSQREIRSAQ